MLHFFPLLFSVLKTFNKKASICGYNVKGIVIRTTQIFPLENITVFSRCSVRLCSLALFWISIVIKPFFNLLVMDLSQILILQFGHSNLH